MLISINGTIIDTKHIYKIGPIEKGELNLMYKDKNMDSLSQEDKDLVRTNELYFTISLFNAPHDMSILLELYHQELEQKRLSMKKIALFRQSIIKIWNTDRSDIPQFNIE